MHFHSEIKRDARDLLALAEHMPSGVSEFDCAELRDLIRETGNDWAKAERMLDRAALALRHFWLSSAHRPGDTTLKSPCEGETTRIPGSGTVDFGYERGMDVSVLEDRGSNYLGHTSGWSSDLVLFRGGQAALSSVLYFAMERWGAAAPLKIKHVGAYFETKSLLNVWSPLLMQQDRPEAGEEVDILVAEPVYCDGQFHLLDTEALPGARRAVVLDTTIVGPDYDLSPWLRAESTACPVLIAFSSGLKLDQAGLELANVGIVRIFARGAEQSASCLAADLRRIRGLTGSGLTLDEMSALSAPWFMDRTYTGRYTRPLFDNNVALAASIGKNSAIFAARCHPSLANPGAVAPFCALQLREGPDIGAYHRLAAIVDDQAARRGLVIDKGGSFGFRGHRFEVIEPEHGSPFLRVALGWRGGHSRAGLCDLFGELAAFPSFKDLENAMRPGRAARSRR